MRPILAFLCLALTALTAAPARPEVSELRIAQQTSVAFLQFNVMKHRGMLEKHAAALGVPDLKVSFATFNGSDAMNDALLAGAVDVVSGGVPGLVIIWSKTHGTSREVRGISAMARMPSLLNSRNPAVKSIKDLTAADKIAMPSVKSSTQAVLLEMAAAKEWGEANFDRLDALTVAMAPSDATTGLLSGGGGFNAAFTVPPFQDMQLKDPAVHTILDSRDIVGPASLSVGWTSKTFHDANPRVYRALIEAIKEASAFIAANPLQAAEYYIADTKTRADPDTVMKIVSGPGVLFNPAPVATATMANFMHRIGRSKVAAASWKDLFFPEIHDLPGE